MPPLGLLSLLVVTLTTLAFRKEKLVITKTFSTVAKLLIKGVLLTA